MPNTYIKGVNGGETTTPTGDEGLPLDDGTTSTWIAIKNLIGRKLRETAGPTTLSMGAIADGEFLKRSGSTVIGGEISLNNQILNGSFQRFERLTTPSTPVAMTDSVYNAPDMWYSLVQGANATIGQAAGIGTSQYSCKLTAGGTTNRYGIAQIIKSDKSIPLRGQTVIFQIRGKITNNAGSGTRNYRIALLEWTGTADTIGATPHDLVSNWASSTFTTAGFFEGTTKTLVGTSSYTLTHGTEQVMSVSGSISTSCNNLILFVWAEDAPTHASDYAQLGEAGLYIASTAQTWKYQDDSFACDEFCQRYGAATGTSMLAGLMDSTSTMLCFVMLRRPMFAAPTFSYGSIIGDWTIRYTGGGVTACTNLVQGSVSKWSSTHTATATGTPLTAGQAGQLRAVNANAYLLYEVSL